MTVESVSEICPQVINRPIFKIISMQHGHKLADSSVTRFDIFLSRIKKGKGSHCSVICPPPPPLSISRRRRKKDAREVHKRSEFAQKVHGIRAKLYQRKRFKEKATMRKT